MPKALRTNANLTDAQHATILGFGMASAHHWAGVAQQQATRIRSLQEELARYLESDDESTLFRGQDPILSIPFWIGVDGHYLVLSAWSAWVLANRLSHHVVGHATLDGALRDFASKYGTEGGRLKEARDVVAHIDDYAIGRGNTSNSEQVIGVQIGFEPPNDPRGDVRYEYETGCWVLLHELTGDIEALAVAAASARRYGHARS